MMEPRKILVGRRIKSYITEMPDFREDYLPNAVMPALDRDMADYIFDLLQDGRHYAIEIEYYEISPQDMPEWAWLDSREDVSFECGYRGRVKEVETRHLSLPIIEYVTRPFADSETVQQNITMNWSQILVAIKNRIKQDLILMWKGESLQHYGKKPT